MKSQVHFEQVVPIKIMKRSMPLLIIGMLIAYMDRINIGFAALHMNKDLGFSPAVYGLGAGLFSVGYFFFEIPSNLLLEKVGPRKWLARIMFTWGLVCIAMAWVHSEYSFYSMRVLLGIAEAGFFPGVLLYLTYWFKEKERATAIATFATGVYLGGLVAAPLSGLMLGLDGMMGFKGWQWVFIIQGIPALVMAFVFLKYLTDKPEQAKWLTEDEKKWLIESIAKENGPKQHASHISALLRVFTNKNVLLLCLIHFLYITLNVGLQLWVPQFIKGAGNNISDMTVSLLTMLPFASILIALVFWGRRSDKYQERRWHATISILLASIGLIFACYANSLPAFILAIVCTGFGIGGFQPVFWASTMKFMTTIEVAAGLALINSTGNLGGFVGPYVMGWTKQISGGNTMGLMLWAGCGLIGALLLQLLFRKTVHHSAGRDEFATVKE